VRQFHAGEIALEFVRDGVNHIWTGVDHLLFLLALLLRLRSCASGETGSRGRAVDRDSRGAQGRDRVHPRTLDHACARVSA